MLWALTLLLILIAARFPGQLDWPPDRALPPPGEIRSGGAMETSVVRIHQALVALGAHDAPTRYPRLGLIADIESCRSILSASNAGRTKDTPIPQETALAELANASHTFVIRTWQMYPAIFLSDQEKAAFSRVLMVRLILEAILYKTRIKSLYAHVLNDEGYTGVAKLVESALLAHMRRQSPPGGSSPPKDAAGDGSGTEPATGAQPRAPARTRPRRRRAPTAACARSGTGSS